MTVPSPREVYNRIKAIFEQPADNGANAGEGAATFTSTAFKLKDGTEISIEMKDAATPSIGDMVSIGGSPMQAGEYELEDGAKITVDATGAISLYTPAVPATQPAATAAPAPTATPAVMSAQEPTEGENAFPTTPEALKAVFDDFATGTPEERIARLETMMKAVMQYCYGYEMQKADRDKAVSDAITAYETTTVAPMQEAVNTAQVQLNKHEETIKGMFELCDLLTKEPKAEPETIPEAKKEGFKAQKEARMSRYVEAAKELKGNGAIKQY